MIPLTQVSNFIWLIRMPTFFRFPQKSTSTYRAVFFDHLRNSLSGRGKVKWKEFYQYVIILSFACFSTGNCAEEELCPEELLDSESDDLPGIYRQYLN